MVEAVSKAIVVRENMRLVTKKRFIIHYIKKKLKTYARNFVYTVDFSLLMW